MTFSAMIINDSRLARVELFSLLETIDEVDIIGEYGNPTNAIDEINQAKPDLLFLNIHMPSMNGFELLDALEYKPEVIFTTGFDHHALRSFEYEAVDYLYHSLKSAPETEKPQTRRSTIRMDWYY